MYLATHCLSFCAGSILTLSSLAVWFAACEFCGI